MINKDRIVPVTKTDLISLYALIMSLAGISFSKLDAQGADGVFDMTSGSGSILAAEPVKSFNFAESVSSATVYFVPGYDFAGFSVNGTAVTPAMSPSSLKIEPDGASLYTAVLSGGDVTISKKGI